MARGKSDYTFVVYRCPFIDPASDPAPDDFLGILTHADNRRFEYVDQNTGSGSFVINRRSDQNDWLEQWNYVRCYRGAYDAEGDLPAKGDAKFGFFLDSGSRIVVDENEDGGEFVQWQGLGTLNGLSRAVMPHVSSLPGGADTAEPSDDPDGNWNWTRRPGPILVRILEELQSRGDPDPVDNSAFPLLTWDFDRDDDSDGNPWPGDPDPPEFLVPPGDNYLYDVLAKLQQTGLRIKIGTDFLLQAWEADIGATTSITFEKGVNITESAEQEIGGWQGRTHVTVRGTTKNGGRRYQTRDESDVSQDYESVFGRIEGFLEYQASPTARRLQQAGEKDLRTAGLKAGGPTTISVLEDLSTERAFEEYWPGDYVTVIVPDAWNDVVKIASIAMVEDDVGKFSPVIHFNDDLSVASGGHGTVSGGCGTCPCDPGEPIDGTDPVAYWGEYYVGGESNLGALSSGGNARFMDQSETVAMTFIGGTVFGVLSDGTIVFPSAETPSTGTVTFASGDGAVRLVARVGCTEPDEEA